MGYFSNTGLLIAATITLLLYGCGKTDYDIDSQNSRIESFLNSKNVDYEYNLGAYKYTEFTRGGTVVEQGDSAYIYYSGYTFSGSQGPLYTTNILQDAVDNSFDTKYMDFNRYGIRMGDGSLLKGLELGLPGSREGDTVMVLMASDLAYGEEAVGIINPGRSVMFKIVIDEVIK